jgi:hypothetical protein
MLHVFMVYIFVAVIYCTLLHVAGSQSVQLQNHTEQPPLTFLVFGVQNYLVLHNLHSLNSVSE